jgi:probable HAF family extracellular repeat protein
MIDLGLLPALVRYGFATGINNKSQVVGISTTDGPQHAFLWQDGEMIDLGTLGGSSIATAINNKGQIVGASAPGNGPSHAVLWYEGTITDLGTLPGGIDSAASAINRRGQVVGFSETPSGDGRAVMWSGGQVTALSDSGGNLASAIGINNKGQVVGYSQITMSIGFPQIHAVLWHDGQTEDLGTFGGDLRSYAGAINDEGQIVGDAETNTPDRHLHAILWEKGQMTDLNTLVPADFGWVLEYAIGINRHGQIIVNGTHKVFDGRTHTFLLTPSRRRGDQTGDTDQCSSSNAQEQDSVCYAE